MNKQGNMMKYSEAPPDLIERAKAINVMLKNHHIHPQIFRRAIQVAAWDGASTKRFWTGLITQEALNSGERVKEHWYSATKLAEDLINLYGGVNWNSSTHRFREIAIQIMSKMTWNYTTKEENQVLKHNNQDYSKISNTEILSDTHLNNVVCFDEEGKQKFMVMMGLG